MFRIESEKDLLEAFRPLDRATVELPRDMKFPLFVPGYLSWVEASGARTYLVFLDESSRKTLGVSFRRTHGGIAPHICDWCHHQGSAAEIGILTADASAKKSVGAHLCLDLDCGARLRSRAELTGESFKASERKLARRMTDFARRTLF